MGNRAASKVGSQRRPPRQAARGGSPALDSESSNPGSGSPVGSGSRSMARQFKSGYSWGRAASAPHTVAEAGRATAPLPPSEAPRVITVRPRAVVGSTAWSKYSRRRKPASGYGSMGPVTQYTSRRALATTGSASSAR